MYNRELQSIDTQEKAYLLGLFYADGNVGINQTQCRIELKLEDKELIFHLQKLFPCKFCDSNDTVCDGYDYYKVKKQRYLCKTCKRHFTAPLSSNIQSGGDELLEG